MMLVLLKELLVFMVLADNSFTDLKDHEVDIRTLAVASFCAAAGHLASEDAAPEDMALGAALGLVLILTALVTRGAVGVGDGLVVCVAGLALGAEENFMLLLTGLILCAAVSLVGLLLGKIKKKQELPFIPFLFLADIWRLLYMLIKNWKKGSFTVEASILIPFLIMIIFVFICLCLFLHDRSVLAACASEMAGKGAAQKYETTDHLEAWVLEEAGNLVEGRLFLFSDVEASVEVTDDELSVSYTGSSALLRGISTTETETASRVNPVDSIKSTMVLTDVVEDVIDTVTDQDTG